MIKIILNYRLDILFFGAISLFSMVLVHVFLARHSFKKKGAPVHSWILLLIILALSFILTERATHTQKSALQEMLQGFAPTYALEMTLNGHSKINIDTPADDALYIKLIDLEKAWLTANPIVNDIYTFGKNTSGQVVLLVDSETDYNRDGLFRGDREVRTAIGEPYPEVSDALMNAFAGDSSFDSEPYTDRWGTWVSAYEPLYDDSGQVYAVLGVDYSANSWLIAIAGSRIANLAYTMILLIVLLTVTGILAMLRSQTDTLKESEGRFRILSEAAPIGIFLTDGVGKCLYTNPRWQSITGMTLEKSLGAGWAAAVHPDDREKVVWAWEKAVESGDEFSLEFRFLRPDGEVRWVDSHAIFITGSPAGFVGTNQDITERKKLETRLLQSQKMETVGTLAGGIAHDLNNHMTPIIGYLDLLAMEIEPSHPAYAMLVETKTAAKQCVEIVRRILDFSRPSSQKKLATDVKKTIEETRLMLSKFFPSTITIETTIGPGVETIHANETEIQSVLMNLAANARDAMPEGGTLRIETSKTIVDGKDFVRFRVSDTGRGIPSDILTKIYEPFFTTKPKGQGTGLGLAMVFTIIMNHGGKIDVISEVGKGTAFEMLLPAGLENPASSKKNKTPDISTLSRGSGTILIVDDEASLRHLAKTFLEKLGYQTLAASDGEEALSLYRIRKNEVVAVLLDMTMPKMTGRQVLQGLLKIDPKANVILVSGYTAEGTSDELIAAGASDFLQKPYTIDSLAKALQKK